LGYPQVHGGIKEGVEGKRKRLGKLKKKYFSTGDSGDG
jgi:hypothetical protein